MKKNGSLYSIPQEILYTICTAAWGFCLQYLSRFTALSVVYTKEFVDTSLKAVAEAQALPQSFVNKSNRKTARKNLINATQVVKQNWQMLKKYILKAYAKDVAPMKLDAAGAALYKKAGYKNWSSVRNLITAANDFINLNLADLTASNIMPPEFQQTFLNAGQACQDMSNTFFNIDFDNLKATSAKIAANNAIYKSLITMLKDGQSIFVNDDAALRQQFIFSRLKARFKKESPASLSGYVFNEKKLPVEGAIINSDNKSYKGVTDNRGYYKITRIAAGAHLFTITSPGYIPLNVEINFEGGKALKTDFTMINAMRMTA